jgi:hypothetical protein
MTTTYVAYRRVQFEGDKVIGMFFERERAEQAIAEYLIKLKDERQCPLEELLFILSSSFEVDTWEIDSTERKDNYGLTSNLIEELIAAIEKQ